MIADSAKDAGIKITPAYPDFDSLVDERNSGKFDLVINNERQIGNTPYTYYDYLFRLPIQAQQTVVNFSRYSNQKAWALTTALNKVKSTDVAKAQKIHTQLQKIQLENLPAIPLWYNGMWAQYNTSVWTNFPTSGGVQEHAVDVERLPQHDRHRRTGQLEAAQVAAPMRGAAGSRVVPRHTTRAPRPVRDPARGRREDS